MKQIPLTQGKWALVDDEDFERVSRFKWHAAKTSTIKGFCARRVVWSKIGTKRKAHWIPLANLIMKPKRGFIVDHINGDALNNQKSNLRVCTQRHNCISRSARRNGSSQYKGVSKHRNGWQAAVVVKGNYHYLGYFKTEKEAAVAYNRGAIIHHGEYARTNGLG